MGFSQWDLQTDGVRVMMGMQRRGRRGGLDRSNAGEGAAGLLLEANFILRLTGRLTKSLRPDDRAPDEPVTKEEED
jgi:hypothetical protein